MAVKPTASAKKDTTAPVKKAPDPKVSKVAKPSKAAEAKATVVAPKPVAKKEEVKKETVAAPKPAASKVVTPDASKVKASASTKAKKEIQHSQIQTATPAKKPQAQAAKSAPAKTTYHVSKRDNDGREWKVFIQGSSKVIKLFDTQAEALEYAKNLCKNKDDGSYVLLHGLNGKIRKY